MQRFSPSVSIFVFYFSTLIRNGRVSSAEKEKGLRGMSGDRGLSAFAKRSSSESWLFFRPERSGLSMEEVC